MMGLPRFVWPDSSAAAMTLSKHITPCNIKLSWFVYVFLEVTSCTALNYWYIKT